MNLSADKLRLVVDRSHKAIYAQIIDQQGKVVATANSLKSKAKNQIESAALVGEKIAELALAKNVKQAVLDRKHYRYHGRIKALAEAAREKGLKI